MATGSGTKITSTGKMVDVANSVTEIIGKYNQAVGKMYDIGNEIDAMWDGPASEKFKSQMNKDQAQFKALADLLQKYVDALNQEVAIYNKAEDDALNTLGTNKIR